MPYLLPLWEPHRHPCLVEYFCGSPNVSLGIEPQHALLNDTNAPLIHFYLGIKRGLQIGLPLQNQRAVFYQYRSRFNQPVDEGQDSSSEAVSLFYSLNRTEYNGLGRFNYQGRLNVPFSRPTRINYLRDFDVYRGRFSGWRFINRDMEEVPLEADDFVYADPPCDVSFTQYSNNGFDWTLPIRTTEWLARHDGPAVLTNQATNRIVDLDTRLGFQLRFLRASRIISRTGERRPAREILATRNI